MSQARAKVIEELKRQVACLEESQRIEDAATGRQAQAAKSPQMALDPPKTDKAEVRGDPRPPRQRGQEEILRRIRSLRTKADNLEALLDSLPHALTPEADAGLLGLIVGTRA